MNKVVDETSWPIWAKNIAYPAEPEEYVEAAVERLMNAIMPYVGDVKNIRPQFKAINKIVMIDFETDEERDYYASAFQRYLENTAKIEGADNSNSKFLILVEWLKFRQAAEMCRKNFLARKMFHGVAEGYATVAAMCFKQSMAAVVKILVEKYHVHRDNIAMIWGGSADFTARAAEKKYSDAEIQQIFADMIAGKTIDSATTKAVKKQLLLSAEGLGNLSDSLRLGPQNFKQRQLEIDRFQSGKALYCLFNFKSGGVGLSLHHCDEMTTQKVRIHPKTGFCYVEDIPLIPTRPRLSYLTPTYSAIELVQGLGRAPRITSLSDTLQNLCFYRGTVEQKVAAVVGQKLKCLQKVVRAKEDWTDVIYSYGHNKKHEDVHVPDEEAIEGNDLFNLDDIGEDDDNENNT